MFAVLNRCLERFGEVLGHQEGKVGVVGLVFLGLVGVAVDHGKSVFVVFGGHFAGGVRTEGEMCIRDRMSEYPHQFSGGMKQRVVIAIALACTPQLIIADEPTTALDVTIQAQVLALMSDLQKKFQTAMLLITHDLGVVAEVCDKVSIMYAGQIVESGPIEKIYDETAHPYTKGLFGSLPSISSKVKRLSPINGLMQDHSNLPKGCPFHPRCPRAVSYTHLDVYKRQVLLQDQHGLLKTGSARLFLQTVSGGLF